MAITLPPYAATLGIVLDDRPGDDERPALRMNFSGALSGRPGHLHGGAIAGLLDMAAHVALLHELDSGEASPRFKTIGITIDYLRGGKEVPTFARGRVTRMGRRVATVVVEAWQEEGKQMAAARLHMLLVGALALAPAVEGEPAADEQGNTQT